MDGVVEVRDGRLRGVQQEGSWAFLGIRYAASPAGEGRWRPPARPEPWVGVRECDRFGPIAPQSPGLVEMTLGGETGERAEDCLSLNIWTPGLDDAKRPVMLWVHGGSFTSGSGTSRLYRSGRLTAENDVVVVTCNYRLGVLGFLAHPALAEPGQRWLNGEEWKGWGNWGLADQVAALTWVRDNIAAFGGDPDNVTLFGESAGGMSIGTLLAVPAAKGLFHKAIIQSGPPHVAPPELAISRAEAIASALGVPLTREALTRVPAADMVRVVVELGWMSATDARSGLLLMPAIDDGLLPLDPLAAVAAGSAADVPLLIGTNRDEASFFAAGSPELRQLDEEGLRWWTSLVAPDAEEAEGLIAAVRRARLDRGEPATPRDIWVALATEFVFRLPSVRLADAHAAAADPGVGTFGYLFTWESPALGDTLGSCHALEIPFVFGTVHDPAIQGFCGGGEDGFSLSRSMSRAWVELARGGAPIGWEEWDPARRPTQVLGPWPGSPELERVVEQPRNEELEALARVVESVVTS